MRRLGRDRGDLLFDSVVVFLMVMLCIITLYPVIYVFSISISSLSAIEHKDVWLWPIGFNLSAYKLLLRNEDIPISFINSVIYTFVGTAYSMLLTVCGAYALSRKWLKGRNFFMLLIAFVMLFDGGLIPTYLLVRDLGLLNKRLVMILPAAVSVWNLIVMRTSMQEIPDSIEESAKIDGANDLTILFKIMIPMVIPVIATIALFYGVAKWNAWFNAMIYLSNRKMFPLQLISRSILTSMTDQALNRSNNLSGDDFAITPLSFRSALMVVTIIPLLLVYPFIQRFFIKGIMIGSIKG